MTKTWVISARMKKRGPVIGIIGIVLVIISFSMVSSTFSSNNPTINGGLLLPSLLDELFDQISDETQIYSNDSSFFSYTSNTSNVPLLWGVQITDFQKGDKITITITDAFDNDIDVIQTKEPFYFETFVIPQSNTYNFEVSNDVDRTILVVMMFSEDPDNSDVLNDPNSPLMKALVPVAIAGIVLILGIILMLIGVIISIIDWQKKLKPV